MTDWGFDVCVGGSVGIYINVTCLVVTKELVSSATKSAVISGVMCASLWVAEKQSSRASLLDGARTAVEWQPAEQINGVQLKLDW
jgi:CII-binding regulator of phage lambda lysogenization HflD